MPTIIERGRERENPKYMDFFSQHLKAQTKKIQNS